MRKGLARNNSDNKPSLKRRKNDLYKKYPDDSSRARKKLDKRSALIKMACNYSRARIQKSGARIERKPTKDFQNLIVWQKAHQFVLSMYHLSDTFPLLLFWILAPDF